MNMATAALPGSNTLFLVKSQQPEHSILPILRQFAGQCVRLVAHSNERQLKHRIYNIPWHSAKISHFFRQVVYWDWIVDSTELLLSRRTESTHPAI